MATRKIKDAQDTTTNELIYFKGHAKATYMSDGRNVEDAIHQIGTGGGGGGITAETDPIFSASPAATITEDKIEKWDKSLETYVAEFTVEELMSVVGTGDRISCDLPALAAAMNENKVILVRESSGDEFKGVSVLNGYVEDLLYFSVITSDGSVIVCTGNTYTEHTLYGDNLERLDRYVFVRNDNLKTINGESIVGKGDMIVGKIAYFSEEDTLELSPGVVWMRTRMVVNSVQITSFASNGKSYEEYAYHFCTGTIAEGSAVKLILPYGVKYANKEIFDALESDTHYELSVVRSIGIVKAVLTAFK